MAIAPVSTSSIPKLLVAGLHAVFGVDTPVYAEQWKEIFKTYDSNKNAEFEVEMRQTGYAAIKAEGTGFQSDSPYQKYVTPYVHKTIGLQTSITMEAIQDNLYEQQFPQMAESFKQSMLSTKNLLGATVLNNAVNPINALADGQPLVSFNHPTDGGPVSNLVNAQLSQAAVEQALILLNGFLNAAGLKINVMPLKIIVPKEQQWTAERIFKSAYAPDNANNAINPLFTRNAIPQGVKVNQYLTSPNNCFIITDISNGFKHFKRMPLTFNAYEDINTGTYIMNVAERYSFGASQFRCTVGLIT